MCYSSEVYIQYKYILNTAYDSTQHKNILEHKQWPKVIAIHFIWKSYMKLNSVIYYASLWQVTWSTGLSLVYWGITWSIFL